MKQLIARLEDQRRKGAFGIQQCGLDDLLAVMNTAPQALSSGELSCMAVAYRTQAMAIMTDDRKARTFAEDSLGLGVETTARLYGWLHYHRRLLDGDHADVIEEHEKYERRPLTAFFNEAYESALQYRLMDEHSTANLNP
jgi:predicted nucleic acid-binding protein